MKWDRRGKYHMTCGDWAISKAYVKGVAVYSLWKGNELIGAFTSADKAKQAAEEKDDDLR